MELRLCFRLWGCAMTRGEEVSVQFPSSRPPPRLKHVEYNMNSFGYPFPLGKPALFAVTRTRPRLRFVCKSWQTKRRPRRLLLLCRASAARRVSGEEQDHGFSLVASLLPLSLSWAWRSAWGWAWGWRSIPAKQLHSHLVWRPTLLLQMPPIHTLHKTFLL
jgi:hypothetical protein